MVTVRVPASTTNLGPGFDVLGLALSLHNEITLAPIEGVGVTVEIVGEGAADGALPRDEHNLVFRAAERAYAAVGQTAPAMRIRLLNRVPLARGLGSSSTAIVGGLVGANSLLGRPLDDETLLRIAVEMEGHPDNVTPALMGGFQVVSATDDEVIHLRLPMPRGLRAVVCVPAMEILTDEAREALPLRISHRDAVFNVGRVALLVAALTQNRPDLLSRAMEDRLHQPYRSTLLPGYDAAVEAALGAGAAGACLSGSGSSLLALTTDRAAAVGEAMVAALRDHGVEARAMELPVDEEGAVVLD